MSGEERASRATEIALGEVVAVVGFIFGREKVDGVSLEES